MAARVADRVDIITDAEDGDGLRPHLDPHSPPFRQALECADVDPVPHHTLPSRWAVTNRWLTAARAGIASSGCGSLSSASSKNPLMSRCDARARLSPRLIR